MFLRKYVKDYAYQLIKETYDEDFLDLLDEDNFVKIYDLFKVCKFYFIEDIIIRYLEIFDMDYDDVYKGILKLREKLGEQYVYYIGNDLRYLEEILKIDDFE